MTPTRRQFLLGSAAAAVSASALPALLGMEPVDETLSRASTFLPKTPRNGLLGSTVIRDDVPWKGFGPGPQSGRLHRGLYREAGGDWEVQTFWTSGDVPAAVAEKAARVLMGGGETRYWGVVG